MIQLYPVGVPVIPGATSGEQRGRRSRYLALVHLAICSRGLQPSTTLSNRSLSQKSLGEMSARSRRDLAAVSRGRAVLVASRR